MGIYTGLTVKKIPSNQRRFELVMNEVYHYLQLHSEEVKVEYEANKFLSIQALFGSDVAHLPLICTSLRSSFFRIYPGSSPPEDVKKFGAVLWESLHILKEHYPSKIELSHEFIDLCAPYFQSIPDSEALRREVSCVASRKEEQTMLHPEEMEDLWCVFQGTVQAYDLKGTLVCLEIFESNVHCPAIVFKSTEGNNLKALERLGEEVEDLNALQYPGLMEKIRVIAQNVLKKILTKHPEKTKECTNTHEDLYLDAPRTFSDIEHRYEKPNSLRALMFQLAETTSIDRVSFLLSFLAKEIEPFDFEPIKMVVDRFADGFYEETEVVRVGLFQCNLLSLVANACKSQQSFQALLSIDFFGKYFLIVEDACRLAYESLVNEDHSADSKIIHFIENSIKIAELVASPSFYEHMRSFQLSLQNISSKLLNLASEGMPAPEELRLISEDLYQLEQRLLSLITKLEALLDYQERHEDKFTRLFGG